MNKKIPPLDKRHLTGQAKSVIPFVIRLISFSFVLFVLVGGFGESAMAQNGDLTVYANASATDIVVENTVQFNVNVSDGTAPYTYEWDFDDVDSYKNPTASQNPTHTFNWAGKHYVEVEVTDSASNTEIALLVVQVNLGANVLDAITDCGCVDDNETDNTPAIQGCLDSYQNSDVTIIFRTVDAGIYLFNQASGTGGNGQMAYAFILNNLDKVAFIGDLSRPTLKWQNPSVVDDKQDGFIAFGACTDVKVLVRNLNLVRDMQGASHPDTDCQFFFRNEPISGFQESIEDCTITDFTALSGGFSGVAKRLNFRGFGKYRPYDVWPGRVPLAYFHSNSLFKHLYSNNGAIGSTHHYYGSGDYSYIIENYIDGTGQDTSRLGLFFKASSGDHVGVGVIGNIIRDTTGTSIAMGKHDQTQIDFIIKDNRLLNVGDPDGGFAIMSGPITSATFEGNFASDTPYSTYYFSADNVNVVFKDNVAGYSSGTDAGKQMVRCDGVCNLVETGSVDNSSFYLSTDPSGWYDAGGYLDPGPYEFTPPTTNSFQINNGAGSTTSTTVTLNIDVSDSDSGMGNSARFPFKQGGLMIFSNDNLNWYQVEDYSTTHTWTLIEGDGTKTVYAKFRDRDGNWTDAVSDTITLASSSTTYGISNFINLVSDWLKTESGLESDVNGDGVVNTRDLGIMMSNWQ